MLTLAPGLGISLAKVRPYEVLRLLPKLRSASEAAPGSEALSPQLRAHQRLCPVSEALPFIRGERRAYLMLASSHYVLNAPEIMEINNFFRQNNELCGTGFTKVRPKPDAI